MSASREKRKRREERANEPNKNVKKSGLSEKSKGVIKNVVSVVIVVAILAVIIGNSGILPQKVTALTLGTSKVSAATFNYYYHDAYNNMVNTYGDYISYFLDTSTPLDQQNYSDDQTWADYFTESATTSAQQIETLCAAADAAGYTLPEEDAETVESYITSMESYVTSSGYSSLKSYLVTNYGKGSTVDSYKEYVEKSYLASDYAEKVNDDFTYTEDDLRAYYDENKDDLDTVDYRAFSVNAETAEEEDTDFDTDAALEDARAIADSMATQAQGDEAAFIDLAKENTDEELQEDYDDDSTLYTNTKKSSVSSLYADWLFSADRVEGETTVIENDTTGFIVVMFLSRNSNDYETVNVRHILIEPASDDEEATEYTDEQWAEAEERAEALLAEFEAGDKTEDSFAELATNNSADSGSVDEGGLYEGVYQGQMVTEFNDWCFDESRETGDYEIVKSSYGYHIMYFVGYGDQYWEELADSGLRDEDYTAWYEEQSAAFEPKTSSFGMFFTTK